MTIFDQILARKRDEVAERQAVVAGAEMAQRAEAERSEPRGFRAALYSGERPRVIAEIKRRSPSRGEIRPDFDPVACALAYADAGAAAISVLTDEPYFGGRLEYLQQIRKATRIPLLRKDFIIDPYQIDETRVSGADAVLLIVAAFPGVAGAERLAALRRRAVEWGLDVLVEVHDEPELEIALAIGADLVGINNRDLKTFEVEIATTERLAVRVPEGVVVVAESGIFTHGDIERLEISGAHAFLVGESLMRQPDPGLALRDLRRNT